MPESAASPAARALACLALVQGRPGITAQELAVRLGVSDRAVRRYVAALREAEIPVGSVSGPHGGYRLGRGVRMPPLLFSRAEALALTMAAMVSVSGGVDDVVARALTTLVQTLPGRVGEQTAEMWRRAVPTPGRVDTRPDPSTSSTLVALAAERRRARLTYRTASGALLERTVDPWALVVRRQWWYLLCHDHGAAAVRTYRVDRVISVTGLDERFEPPEDLDPAAAVEQHLGAGRRYPTLVRFDAPIDRVRPLVGAVMGRLESVDDGAACLLTGTTDNPAMYAGEWLAAIPLPLRVLGGEELRAAVRDVAARMAAAVEDAARLTGAAQPGSGRAGTHGGGSAQSDQSSPGPQSSASTSASSASVRGRCAHGAPTSLAGARRPFAISRISSRPPGAAAPPPAPGRAGRA